MKYDWGTIRHEYVTSSAGNGEITIPILAQKYGCGTKRFQRRIEERSARDGWVALREKHRGEIAEEGRKKAIETAAQRLARRAQAMRIIQNYGLKAIVAGVSIPTPGQIVEASKHEGALYGEVESRTEIISHDEACEIWKAGRRLKERGHVR